jgi:hypothetical protein
MNIKASTGKARRECLSRYAEKVELRAQFVFETSVLAFLFSTIADRGRLVMTKHNGDTCTYEAPGFEPPCESEAEKP